jgi:hypothetical protein
VGVGVDGDSLLRMILKRVVVKDERMHKQMK